MNWYGEMFRSTETQLADWSSDQATTIRYYGNMFGYTKVFHVQTVQWWEDQADRIAQRLGLPVKEKEEFPEWDNEGGKNGL
ncbi:hypothetical protein SEA_GUEY18_24 [Gordonia phage Guey18]|uniref:Uncharacterized protein n=1 Tax=Gordonia phage Ziko TaxID=2591193 RepID=A0A514A543_9CAUD|nr:hypothetical protein SEA_ZIKO_23 [Gordonia phage Ziko]QTF81809.1 hypothetical protein SEA_GUEY18_24 [Gordonia phage Guey18]